jgi:hypothetical protein
MYLKIFTNTLYEQLVHIFGSDAAGEYSLNLVLCVMFGLLSLVCLHRAIEQLRYIFNQLLLSVLWIAPAVVCVMQCLNAYTRAYNTGFGEQAVRELREVGNKTDSSLLYVWKAAADFFK